MPINDTNYANLCKQLPYMEVKSPYYTFLGLHRKANVDFSKMDIFEQYWIHIMYAKRLKSETGCPKIIFLTCHIWQSGRHFGFVGLQKTALDGRF